jgi:putative ABC transport system substrate-binding protein
VDGERFSQPFDRSIILLQHEESPRLAPVQQATKTIPIVTMSGDMLKYGFVNSLARPDGNTTGVSILAIDLDGKRQDILIRRRARASSDGRSFRRRRCRQHTGEA